jgi:uncharacterized protein (TIGR03435 family)
MGAATITLGSNGAARVEVSSIAGLMDYVSAQVSEPVADRTGLQGTFNLRLDCPALDLSSARNEQGRLDAHVLRERTQERLRLALERAGFRLERTRLSLPTVIVEHAEKAPTEN